MPNLWVSVDELGEDSAAPEAYEACQTASYIMWALSGRRYSGLRTVTESYTFPCRSVDPIDRLYSLTGGVRPGLQNGAVVNSRSSCGCPGSFGGVHSRLRLRGTPARSVQKVVSGGETLDPSRYALVRSSVLQAAPGTALLDLNGVEVTYTYGVEPPIAGRRAARLLARELVYGWSGDDRCSLPERVTSVTREGISFQVLDDQSFLNEFRTGIYAVDLFLKAANPAGAFKRAKVFSPDMPRATRKPVSRTPDAAGPHDLVVRPGEALTWSVNLAAAGATILADEDWEPQGQISAWNGAQLLEFSPERFAITGSMLTISLTADETSRLSFQGGALWDLYALNKRDGFTVIHTMSSTVYVV